jgi:hypothetical protein
MTVRAYGSHINRDARDFLRSGRDRFDNLGDPLKGDVIFADGKMSTSTEGIKNYRSLPRDQLAGMTVHECFACRCLGTVGLQWKAC